jgi:histidinol-phosphate/aromatic aminotransferase/cobyric acid decarboxylase-like protein/GTP:adenosylcobinamide-phosphate guanylyltransferase
MQAVIPAAGMGRRMKTLTAEVTKCMMKVNGITLIERMLVQLDKLNLSRIVIIVGYESGKLKDFVETLDVKTPIVYVNNPVYDKTNNIYSLYLAREYLRQQDTLLIESDLIFDDCLLKTLIDDPQPSLALVARFESWMDGSVVTLRDGNTINDFLSKDQFKFQDIKDYYKTVNIYKFSREFLDSHYVPFLEAYCHALGNNEYYEQVLKVITKLDKSELRAKILEKGNWYEIDDIQDLDIAESIFDPSEEGRLKRLQRRYGGYWRYPGMIDFSYLVNPFYPPQKLMDEIKANFETLVMQYPSGQRVNSLLAAKYFDVSPSRIAVGNGAAELIKSLLGKISGKIGSIIPTFEEYPNRKKEDILAFKPENDEFSYTVKDLMEFFRDKPIDALVVINPDNPSGNYIPHKDVLRLIEWTGEQNIKLILDESFVDFAAIDDTLLDDDILAGNPHLIVIKSISKSYGVPGLRLGVLACGDEELISFIQTDISIWNINSFGEFYLQICEKYKKEFAPAMEKFYTARDELFTGLSSISFLKPIPSKANYVTCKLAEGYFAREVAKSVLLRNNLLIRDLSGKNGITGEYIRVAVKKPEENAQLIEALRSLYEG